MVSASTMITLALIVCTGSAAPLRGQKSIQKKHARVKRAVGAVGAEVKTTGKMPISFSSNVAPKATVSFGSDEPAISDDERPNILEKVEYTPRGLSADEEGGILPSFNFVLFVAAVIGLVKLQLHLQKRLESSDELLESSKLGKDSEVKDWIAMAQDNPYVQEAMAMISQSMDFASSAAIQACVAADRFAKQTTKPKTDEKCDFGLPEDPQTNLDTRNIQDPNFYQEHSQDIMNSIEMSSTEPLMEMDSGCPQPPVDLIGMEPEAPLDGPHLMDSLGLMDTDSNTPDLVGL